MLLSIFFPLKYTTDKQLENVVIEYKYSLDEINSKPITFRFFEIIHNPIKVCVKSANVTFATIKTTLSPELTTNTRNVAIINKNGDVTDVKVLKHMSMGLSEASVAAIKKWKFSSVPGSSPQWVTVKITFKLK